MKLKVIVVRRPNMFLVNMNMYNMVGVSIMESIMHDPDYKDSGSLTLYYPERFLNIVESRILVDRIRKAGIEDLHIVTQCVYIMQTVNNTNLGVLDDDIDGLNEGGTTFKKSNDNNAMPDDSGLTVL